MSKRTGSSLADLVDLMARLLGPGGCPWDQEQDLDSLRPYLIEECFELVDAIDSKNVANHREELGDLLFQIVFQSSLRAQEGAFDIDDVIRGIHDKLVFRHPHVFEDEAGESDSDRALGRWEEQKAKEKAAKGETTAHLLDAVPVSLPALVRAQAISKRVSKVGFDWPDTTTCLAKVREECDEVQGALEHGNEAQIQEEIGDLLFATVSLARKSGVDPELALANANRKFINRFNRVEDILRNKGTTPKDSNLQEMDEIWESIKHAKADPSSTNS